jgi:hypothetical protein
MRNVQTVWLNIKNMLFLIHSQSDGAVKHYHVKKNNEGKFYITEGYAFSSLAELVVFHKKDSHGKQYNVEALMLVKANFVQLTEILFYKLQTRKAEVNHNIQLNG